MSEESKKSKRIAKNTLVLYVRMLFLMLVHLYTSRVILQALGVTDYGIYNVVGGFVSMFALISSALTSACQRFLNFEMGKGDIDRLKSVFSTSLTIQYALATIIAILCETFGLWYLNNKMVLPPDRLSAANWVIQFSIITFCSKLITVPYNAAIIAHEKMKTFAYVSIFDGIAQLIISYLVMISPMDKLIFYAMLLCGEQFIVRSVYRIYCQRNFEECKYRFVFDKTLLKSIFSYTGWHLVGNTSGILKNQGVSLILNLFFGPALNAARGVANQVLHAVTSFASNFMMAMNPQITQSYAKGNYQYMMNLVFKGARYSFYMIFLLSAPIIINADYILHLWLKKVPDYSVVFCQLSLTIAMLSSLSKPLITAQNATGDVRNYQLVVGGVQLLDIPMCYIWLKLGGNPLTVMYVALTVEVICMMARIYMIHFTIPEFRRMAFCTNVLLNVLTVSLCAFVVPFLCMLTMEETFLNFIAISLISVLCSIGSILYIGCKSDERKMIFATAQKVRKKIKSR